MQIENPRQTRDVSHENRNLKIWSQVTEKIFICPILFISRFPKEKKRRTPHKLQVRWLLELTISQGGTIDITAVKKALAGLLLRTPRKDQSQAPWRFMNQRRRTISSRPLSSQPISSRAPKNRRGDHHGTAQAVPKKLSKQTILETALTTKMDGSGSNEDNSFPTKMPKTWRARLMPCSVAIEAICPVKRLPRSGMI